MAGGDKNTISMEEELKSLERLLYRAKRDRGIYKHCATKTYCSGNESMREAYDISRKVEWGNMKALRLAIRLVKKEIETTTNGTGSPVNQILN